MSGMPTDAAIERVMQDTGMERVQAYRHLRDRAILQERLRRGDRRINGRGFR